MKNPPIKSIGIHYPLREVITTKKKNRAGKLYDARVCKTTWTKMSWDEFYERALRFELQIPPTDALRWYRQFNPDSNEESKKHTFPAITNITSCLREQVFSRLYDHYTLQSMCHYVGFGQAVHKMVESGKDAVDFAESRAVEKINILGEEMEFPGRLDFASAYKLGFIVGDYKTHHDLVENTIIWSASWWNTLQLNLLAYINRDRFPKIERLSIYYFCRDDWCVKDVPIWKPEATRALLEERLTKLMTGWKDPSKLPSVQWCMEDMSRYADGKLKPGGNLGFICRGWESRPVPCPFWETHCRQEVEDGIEAQNNDGGEAIGNSDDAKF